MDINNEQITKVENTNEYDKLIEKVGETLQRGRNKLASALKGIMVETYWEIGRDIVEFEQCGNAKAEYGSDTLNRLSKDLTERYGRGFSRTNVVYIRKLYLVYPNSQTLSDQLSFSHYIELLKIEDPLERSFYEKKWKKGRTYCFDFKGDMSHFVVRRIM